jgi:hypothetical protein
MASRALALHVVVDPCRRGRRGVYLCVQENAETGIVSSGPWCTETMAVFNSCEGTSVCHGPSREKLLPIIRKMKLDDVIRFWAFARECNSCLSVWVRGRGYFLYSGDRILPGCFIQPDARRTLLCTSSGLAAHTLYLHEPHYWLRFPFWIVDHLTSTYVNL